jgi:hypothetical protein
VEVSSSAALPLTGYRRRTNVSVDVAPLASPRPTPTRWRVSRRADRSERRRLASQDRLSAQLGELHRIRALLTQAATVVSSGWVQHGWFSVAGQHGEHYLVSAHAMSVVDHDSISGACLVGAIVHAGGGPAAVHTQLVQRTLDLGWHTLYEDPQRPVRWCPAPAVRMAHVRDLTRWNDSPQRTAAHVGAFFGRAIDAADAQRALVLAR